jgi:hypothetical protein
VSGSNSPRPSSDVARQWPSDGGGWLWYAAKGPISTGIGGRIIYADLNGDHKADYLQVNADSSVQGGG